jgi:hypothetical protein
MIRVMLGLREQVFKRLELPEQLHQRYGATKVALLPKFLLSKTRHLNSLRPLRATPTVSF